MILITDRTEDDVLNRTAKGYYNYTDLNRISTGLNTLSGQINGYGYQVTASFKSNWKNTDLPQENLLQDCLDGINAMNEGFWRLPGTPELPNSFKNITWQGANDIEQNLYNLDALVGWLEESFVYSDEIYSGER